MRLSRLHPLDNLFVYFLGTGELDGRMDGRIYDAAFISMFGVWRNFCCELVRDTLFSSRNRTDDWQAWQSITEADYNWKWKREDLICHACRPTIAKCCRIYLFYLFSQDQMGNESRLMPPPVYSKTIFISLEAAGLNDAW